MEMSLAFFKMVIDSFVKADLKNVLDYIDDDSTIFERAPLEKLTKEGQLAAYKHRGFWKPMDTLRDKTVLENAWLNNKAPWKLWDTK